MLKYASEETYLTLPRFPEEMHGNHLHIQAAVAWKSVPQEMENSRIQREGL
jgi:hypothetical protein